MKILFLPNWKVHQLDIDDDAIQAPDKQINGSNSYWFFKYFKQPYTVDIIDFQQKNLLSWLEKKANIYIWQSIKAFFQVDKYDVIISHGAQSGLMIALLNTIFNRKTPLHIIFDIGAMNGAKSHRFENAVIKFALKSNPFIICHSQIIIDYYKSAHQNLVAQSCYIPFGVDTDYFEQHDAVPATRQDSYILSFGSAKRDYKTLLAAWDGVKSTHRLRLIGCRQAVDRPNVDVIEKVSIQSLKKHISNALFVVIPLPLFNYSYGQMSFLQSMSMGKTVIVTKTPSSVDYIIDGQGAFFVKPFDVSDMHAKLSLLINNKKLLEESSNKARQYVLVHFAEQQMAEKIEQFILACLKKNKTNL